MRQSQRSSGCFPLPVPHPVHKSHLKRRLLESAEFQERNFSAFKAVSCGAEGWAARIGVLNPRLSVGSLSELQINPAGDAEIPELALGAFWVC